MTKVKPLIHTAKKCGGTYEVLHNEQDIPYLQCETCGHCIEDWVKWTKTYKNYWEDSELWEQKKNHITCLLGVFAAQFKNQYNFEYSWSLNEKGLFRGPEANILRRVYNTFDRDPLLVREYIDWYFTFKVRRRKKRITSLSFLAVSGIMNEFKMYKQSNKQIKRDKKIPNGMHRWIRDFAPSVAEQMTLIDFGDLKIMLEHYKNGSLTDTDVVKFIKELKRQIQVDDANSIRNWRE